MAKSSRGDEVYLEPPKYKSHVSYDAEKNHKRTALSTFACWLGFGRHGAYIVKKPSDETMKALDAHMRSKRG